MKQTLILLAGYPGTGKSYLANLILERFTNFVICSPDDMKEELWDMYGFHNLDEKECIIQESWSLYYQRLTAFLENKQSIISDYPFSNKQKATLNNLATTYHVTLITIRLVGDLKILYERQKKRDLQNTRHLGHIVCSYHKGMNIQHHNADYLLNYEEFMKRCTTRGYGEFSLGYTIEIDVSDFTKVNYNDMLNKVQAFIE